MIDRTPSPDARNLHDRVSIGKDRRIRPSHCYRLQVFRPHHGPHAGSAIEVPKLVGDAGEPHKPLSGGAYERHAGPGIAQLLANHLLSLPGDLTPYPRGVFQLSSAIMNPEIRRLR